MSRSAEAFFTLSHRFVFIYASTDRALQRPAVSYNSDLTIGRVVRRRNRRVVVKLQVFQKTATAWSWSRHHMTAR